MNEWLIDCWNQLDGEDAADYAKFLVYRNLGPGRSLDRAYRAYRRRRVTKSGAPLQAPGSWAKLSVRYEWVNRASRWDVYHLEQAVPEVVSTIFALIGEFARKTLESVQSGAVSPRNWDDVLRAIDGLTALVSPEAAAAALDLGGHESQALSPPSDES